MRFVQAARRQIDSQQRPQRNLRALFLSDIHLGSRDRRSDRKMARGADLTVIAVAARAA